MVFMDHSHPLCLPIRLAFTFLLFLCPLLIAAQEKDWRPIEPADLASKAPIVEPDADAEAIFWEVRIDDSSSEDLSLKHYVRVKIYTERGREKFSKFDVPFTKRMKIKDLAARVIRADGSIIEIKKEDIFEREIIKAGGVKVKAKSFAVPNIEPGVIVEYKYKEAISNATATGMDLDFQRDIPVQRLAYYYKPFAGNKPNYQTYNFTDTKFIKDKDGFWLALRTDVPSLKEEPRMPPEGMVRPWMLLTGARGALLEASAMGYTYVVKDPANQGQYWGGVGREYSFLTKWMNKSSGDIKKAAAEITAGATTPDEKLKKLYLFCQTEIKNTTYDPSLTDEMREKLPKPKSVGDALKLRSGAASYVDLLFGALAKAAGFETAIALTGDRRKMFFTPEMTNESLVHPAAIAIKVGEEWKFFNPGMKFLPYGSLAWNEEDTYALIVGDENYAWRQTPYTDFSKSASNRKASFVLNDDGSLEGDVTLELNGQPALSYRRDNYDETDTKREQNLSDEIKTRLSAAEVSNIKVENLTDSSKPLVEKYHIRVPGFAQKTGKRLFLQPNYFKYGMGPVFSSAARKYDIFFGYPWSENDEIEITWPAGFDLDNADSPAYVADPRKIGELNIRLVADRPHNLLKYSRQFHFGGGGSVLFGSASYGVLKTLFDSFNTADSHTITLKQK
jgi:hypothetical protein